MTTESIPRRTDEGLRDTLTRMLAALPTEHVAAAGLGYHAGVLDQPRRAELDQRRSTPHGCRRGRCSACTRTAAIRKNRELYASDNYPGAQ